MYSVMVYDIHFSLSLSQDKLSLYQYWIDTLSLRLEDIGSSLKVISRPRKAYNTNMTNGCIKFKKKLF